MQDPIEVQGRSRHNCVVAPEISHLGDANHDEGFGGQNLHHGGPEWTCVRVSRVGLVGVVHACTRLDVFQLSLGMNVYVVIKWLKTSPKEKKNILTTEMFLHSLGVLDIKKNQNPAQMIARPPVT